MKILQINAVYSIASTGRTCAEMHDFLVENGNQCITAYGECKGNYQDTVFVGNALDHKIHALLSRITGKIGYYSLWPTLKLLRYIEKEKIEIVHIRVLHSNFINIPVLLEYLGEHNVPTVVTLHDCFWFTGKCCHYVGIPCYKWEKQCSDCPVYKDWNPSWFLDRTEKMFTDKVRLFSKIRYLRVVGVSNWITQEAGRSAVFKENRISTIYNTVNTGRFYPREIGTGGKTGIKKKYVLGVASDWNESKGLSDFIRIAEIIEDDYNVVIIGNLPDHINIPQKMIHIDRTSDIEELASFYSSATVFLQLSRQETFGKVTAEALACGTPVIAYRNTANTEMIFPGCGYCIDRTGDVEAVLSRIYEISDTVRHDMSGHCREAAVRYFSHQSECRKYLNLYHDLISETKAEV